MLNLSTIQEFQGEVKKELLENILPFWMGKTVDVKNGGFYGRIENDLRVNHKAPKGAILNSRILWTFAAAYRLLEDERYLVAANRAFDYLQKYFWDEEHDGLFFMVNYKGRVMEPQKLVYNQAFGIYGFSEYYRATGNTESLNRAIRLYRLIDEYCRDQRNQGYFESRSRDWRLYATLQIDSHKMIAKKTMNTHLHLLEAYTNLLQVWENEELRNRLLELVTVFGNQIFNTQTGHLKFLFDEDWNSKMDLISFGHDIEGSWLLYEAALVLGDESVLKQVRELTLALAQKGYEEGFDAKSGGLFYELENGKYRRKKIWWVQSEAMVGFLNAFQLTGREYFLEAAYEIWRFIKRSLVDGVHGEWFWEASRKGQPQQTFHKVGPWKCPYHNSRACMEIMARMNKERFLQYQGS